MQIVVFSEFFFLFKGVNLEILEWFLFVVVKYEYFLDRLVLMEDVWGNVVYFVVLGWVKVRCRLFFDNLVILVILGRGDFFGEMVILDELFCLNDVVVLFLVCLISILV